MSPTNLGCSYEKETYNLQHGHLVAACKFEQDVTRILRGSHNQGLPGLGTRIYCEKPGLIRYKASNPKSQSCNSDEIKRVQAPGPWLRNFRCEIGARVL